MRDLVPLPHLLFAPILHMLQHVLESMNCVLWGEHYDYITTLHCICGNTFKFTCSNTSNFTCGHKLNFTSGDMLNFTCGPGGMLYFTCGDTNFTCRVTLVFTCGDT